MDPKVLEITTDNGRNVQQPTSLRLYEGKMCSSLLILTWTKLQAQEMMAQS